MLRTDSGLFQLHRFKADCQDALMEERRLKAMREVAPREVLEPATAILRETGELKSHPSFWVAAWAAIGHFATALLVWRESARLHRQLLSLSDHALKDIGRSRADTMGEGDPRFWRARID